MIKDTVYHIGAEIIDSMGLRLTDRPVSSLLAVNARVYEFPTLQNVFVMESDFYGNPMPEGSCFLAYYGRYGYIGTDLPAEKLKETSAEDIKKMIQSSL